MAEFLITKRIHWATINDVTADGGIFPMDKFNARPIPGDIIEVHPDGFWRVEALKQGLHGWDRTGRNLIRIPGLKYDQVEALTKPSCTSGITGNKMVKRKFSNYIENWKNLPWVKNKVVINGCEFEECYLDLKNLEEVQIVEKVVL